MKNQNMPPADQASSVSTEQITLSLTRESADKIREVCDTYNITVGQLASVMVEEEADQMLQDGIDADILNCWLANVRHAPSVTRHRVSPAHFN